MQSFLVVSAIVVFLIMCLWLLIDGFKPKRSFQSKQKANSSGRMRSNSGSGRDAVSGSGDFNTGFIAGSSYGSCSSYGGSSDSGSSCD